MRKNLLISLFFLVIIFFILQRQGRGLISPQSPHGIIDLEFAKTPERLHQLQLFWNGNTVLQNIYLDFLFIIAYTWFLVTACKSVKNSKSHIFSALTISAAAFDVLENFLMILVLNGRFNPSVMQIVYYAAAIKFILIVIVAGFIILSLLGLFRKESSL